MMKTMIKFRLGTLFQKLFYRAEKVKWEDMIILDPLLPIKVNVYRLPEFEKDLESHLLMYRRLIKRYLKDLSDLFLYENNFPSDDTEYLDQLSFERVDGSGVLVYSKKVVGDDRFCYQILMPYKENNEYIINVLVYSCKGHKRPDGGSYWDPDPVIMEEIIKPEIIEYRKRFK